MDYNSTVVVIVVVLEKKVKQSNRSARDKRQETRDADSVVYREGISRRRLEEGVVGGISVEGTAYLQELVVKPKGPPFRWRISSANFECLPKLHRGNSAARGAHNATRRNDQVPPSFESRSPS